MKRIRVSRRALSRVLCTVSQLTLLGTAASGAPRVGSPAASAGAPGLPRAEVVNCFGCNLGIFDDPSMTTNRGTMAPVTPKDIYLGIQYDTGFSSLTGIEFSVAGIQPASLIILSLETLPPATF